MISETKPWHERLVALPAVPIIVCAAISFASPEGWASPHHGWFLLLGPLTVLISALMYRLWAGRPERVTTWDFLAAVVAFPLSFVISMWGGGVPF